ncbi:MAG: UDP-2,3-diacylglucosamine diphosphatase (EC [uncultured Thiotrichaceae bacterium]|uniref:UDP-2,3-diacylglucosamine hydrolase n=1 Tax=uncultured Thiotrichaceae bacterium TaxID=298394 RepID=A0A6S6T2U1_9GAMM|nr:MAG: UDP-2,3-diacylglucosamine diphosphatase (EC [uncultured Thiotrichaceae bacterium]
MTTWFISDLHLEPSRPASIQQLFAFLQHINGEADALYILGDLFEFWVGDDYLDTPEGQAIAPLIQALRAVSDSGVPIYFMHGNRDFLLGERFATETGCTILPEQQVVDLYGTPTLLLHGDTLCTDDADYQKARAVFRNPKWIAQVLTWTIPQRIQRAQEMREVSKESTQHKSEEIMDVNQQSVEQVMRDAKVTRLIHGHTHRPAIHDFQLEGVDVQRIVLGDWYTQGSYLRVDETSGITLLTER